MKVLAGQQTTCGVLHCLEQGAEPRLAHITELTVFKSSTGPGARTRRTVAVLSERKSRVSTLWDGIKVEGTWSKQRAELSLYLLETDDCKLAEFSCQVHIVDGYKERRVGFARLGTDSDEPAASTNPKDEASTASTAILLQLSAMLQQNAISFHTTTTELYSKLHDNIRDLENRVGDQITALGASIARHSAGNVDSTVQNRIDKSLSLLSAMTDQLAAAVEKTNGAVSEKPAAERGSSLVRQQSCVRREANYQVVIPGAGESPYLCDLHTEGGGWVIIQRRSTGNVDFYKNWSAYKHGFGSLADDFWLGNDRIHALTSQGSYELMVSLRYGNISAFAHYQTFSLDDESNNYTLRIGGYDGSAGDSLSGHRNQAFSTYDQDNDKHESANCAVVYRGAWWYNKCHSSNLNGEWKALGNKGPRWLHLSASDPVDFTEMKIRKV